MYCETLISCLGLVRSQWMIHWAIASFVLAFIVLAVGSWAAKRRPWNPFRKRTDQRLYWEKASVIRGMIPNEVWERFVSVVKANELPPRPATLDATRRSGGALSSEEQRYVAELQAKMREVESHNWLPLFRWYAVAIGVGERDCGTPKMPRRRVLPFAGEEEEEPTLQIVMSMFTNLIYNILFYGSTLLLVTGFMYQYMPTSHFLNWLAGAFAVAGEFWVLFLFDAHGFYQINEPDRVLARTLFGKVLAQFNVGGLLVLPAGITRLDNNPDKSGQIKNFTSKEGATDRVEEKIDMDPTNQFSRREIPGGSVPIHLGTIGVDPLSYIDAGGDDEEEGPDGKKKGGAKSIVNSISLWFSGVIAWVKVVNVIVERAVLSDDIGPALWAAIAVSLSAAVRIVVEHDPSLPLDKHHPFLDGLNKPKQKYCDPQAHRDLILKVAVRHFNEWGPPLGVQLEELVSDDPFNTEDVEAGREQLKVAFMQAAGELVNIEVLGKRLETLGQKGAFNLAKALEVTQSARDANVNPTAAFITGIAMQLAPGLLEMALANRKIVEETKRDAKKDKPKDEPKPKEEPKK